MGSCDILQRKHLMVRGKPTRSSVRVERVEERKGKTRSYYATIEPLKTMPGWIVVNRSFNAYLTHVFDAHTYSIQRFIIQYETIFFIPGFEFFPYMCQRHSTAVEKRIMPNWFQCAVIYVFLKKYPNVNYSTVWKFNPFCTQFCFQMPFIGTLPNSEIVVFDPVAGKWVSIFVIPNTYSFASLLLLSGTKWIYYLLARMFYIFRVWNGDRNSSVPCRVRAFLCSSFFAFIVQALYLLRYQLNYVGI